jgi:DNA-binding response OmpR family regulator
MKQLPKVLLVEDDRSIAGALAQALRSAYDVDVAGSGKLAFYKVGIEDYDIILLDLSLPDIHGLSICLELRARNLGIPILVISGEANVLTKINLLDAGANDYLTKPFSLGELKARLRMLIRNVASTAKTSSRLTVGDLTLDRQNQIVWCQDTEIPLRRKEFALLECLMEHTGVVVSREALARHAWQGHGGLWTNTVDVHIKHLRDKIDRPFNRQLIQTMYGLGYKFELLQPVLVTESD